MATVRYKMTLAYRGARYHGWQRQLPAATWKGPMPPEGQGIPTIQETVARTMAKVLGRPIQVVGSSRTDAGVHAKGQVAHFDLSDPQIPPLGILRAVNHQLPPDILIRHIEPAPPAFHAILDTAAKRYQYAIWAADFRNPFVSDLYWHRWRPLDAAVMAAAAVHFAGTHDFASFARPGHQRENTVRTIFACDVARRGPILVIGVTGAGFLWNMVRIIVGTLVEVGVGLYQPDEIPKMIAARDRRAAGSTAPPQGLFLQWIKYRRITDQEIKNPPAATTAPDSPAQPDCDAGNT